MATTTRSHGAVPHRRTPQRVAPQPSRRRRPIRSSSLPYLLLVPAAVLELAVHVVPMVVGVWMSLLEMTQFHIHDWTTAPFIGMDNYKATLNIHTATRKALLHSFWVTILYTIRPFVTLYHWDLPQALQDRGGWPERSTAEAFADYTAVLAGLLGDRVADWNTVNEPLCVSLIGHLEGRMAPGERDLDRAVRTSHHVLLGHGLAMQAVRANARLDPSVGIVLNLSPCEPGSDRPADVAAARRADGHVNRWWLDPLYGRGYPADMIQTYGVEPPVQGGDLAIISAPTEFLGVNYYFRQVIVDDPGGGAPFVRQVPVPGSVATSMDWEVYPKGLYDILMSVSQTYRPPSILVTESGSAWWDEVGPTGEIEDKERTDYHEQHLEACFEARRAGAPVDGYFAWSLLDNFEWAYGLDKRFGLVHVDYATQRRTMKASGNRFASLISAHRRLGGR